MLRKTSFVAALSLTGLLLQANAQTPDTPPPPAAQAKPSDAKPKDYGAGFEKFFKLGLPDVSGAKYVTLSLNGMHGGRISMLHQTIQGNAWLVKEDKEAGSRFVTVDGQELTVHDFQAAIKKMSEANKGGKGARIYMSLNDDPRLFGRWSPADFKKDLEKIMAVGRREPRPKDHEYQDRMEAMSFGVFLLMAAEAYKSGSKDEANQIAAALFAKDGSPQKTIAKAMNTLADAKYNDALDAFFVDGDWNALTSRIEANLASFRTAWRLAPGAKTLLEKIKDRTTQTPPALQQPGLSEADVKLAAELLDANAKSLGNFNDRNSIRWLLGKGGKAPKADVQPSITERIRAGGLNSMPLLLALLKDTSLTKLDSMPIRGLTFGIYDMYDRQPPSHARIYAKMRRPITRREFAEALLRGILPGEENGMRDEDGDGTTLHDKALEWYGRCKACATPLDLAKLYLAEGGARQRTEAAAFILKNGAESDFAEIEKVILEGELHDYANVELAKNYIAKQGGKAKDFAGKYVKALEASPQEEEHEKEQVKRALATIKEAMSTDTPKAIIDDILSGKRKYEDCATQLRAKLKKMDRKAAELMLLNGAVSAAKPGLKRHLLIIMETLSAPAVGIFEEEEEKKADSETAAILTPEAVKLWRILLADESGSMADGHISDAAASMIARLYMKSSGPDINLAVNWKFLPKSRIDAIGKARAAKILDGAKSETELPQYPGATPPSETRLAGIITGIKARQGAEALNYLKALNEDELLAVMKEAEKDETLGDGIRQTRMAICAVKTEAPELDGLKDFEGLVGKQIDKKGVERLFELCKRLTLAGKSCQAQIQREPGIEGFTVKLMAMEPEEDAQLQSMVMAGISGLPDNQRANATWTFETPKSKEKGDAKPADDLLADAADELDSDMSEANARRQQEFWKAVETLCAQTKGNAFKRCGIYFTGMAASKSGKDTKN